jgi:acyl-coenzyme A synthetase/AMP-(fatty) acid ligase
MTSTPLHERWLATVSKHPNALALREAESGRAWTFQQLADATAPAKQHTVPCLFPQGNSADFVLEVLRGWAAGAIVCPLEPGQPRPPMDGLSNACAHVKTTSGTTGSARLIAFSASQLAADADNIVRTMGLRPEWPNLGAISLAHSYGFSNLVLPLLLHGIPLILASSPLPGPFSLAAAQAGPITVPAVPVLWRAWHEAGVISPNIRLAISAGAPMPAALERRIFDSTGLKIHNFYGASECGGITFDAADTPRADTAFVGTPLNGVKVSLSEEGCLQVASDAVADTYWPEPDPALSKGRFITSDLAEITANGISLRGRLGDLINVAGRKVSAQLVERVLMECPGVRDCVVFGVSPSVNENDREWIVACVSGPSPGDTERLRRHVASRLRDWQVPKQWWFVESIETTERGKVRRDQWRDLYIKTKLSGGQGEFGL